MLESIGAHIIYPDETSTAIALHVVDSVAFRWPAYRTHRELMAVTRAFTGGRYADAIGIPQLDDPKVVELESQRMHDSVSLARCGVGGVVKAGSRRGVGQVLFVLAVGVVSRRLCVPLLSFCGVVTGAVRVLVCAWVAQHARRS